MSQLTTNTPRQFEVLGETNSVPVKQSSAIYIGSAVGVTGGYARQLVAGDDFVGFSEEKVTAAQATADGAINLVIRSQGIILAAITSAAVTDIGKPVYMSDGNVFTFTATSNSHVGKVVRWISTGYVMVAFQSMFAGGLDTIVALTDNGGGATADNTIAVVTAPTAQTDSSGGSANATLAAQTLPTALTDNGGGTADATVASMAAATNILSGTMGGTSDLSYETVGSTSGGDVSAAIMNNFKEVQAFDALVVTWMGTVQNNFKELTTRQGENLAQLTVLKNVTASYAARQAENRTAIVALTDAVKELSTKVNEIIASSR